VIHHDYWATPEPRPVVSPSDRTGRHDGPEWQRITATPYKADPEASTRVSFTRAGKTRIFNSISTARIMTGLSWTDIDGALKDGQPRCGYAISLAPKETR
jgi:hypothetical protein